MGADLSDTVKDTLTLINSEDEGRACKDIDESACRQEPGNVWRHVTALALSKSADALINPKLVLSWMLTLIGAPVWMAGLLVPIRESGALLPQMFTAGAIRALPRRKWVWTAGAALQGASAIAMGLVFIFLAGAVAGAAILALLGLLALSRSLCSVSYKDILGKTVSKERRGKATGLAASLGALAALALAIALLLAPVQPEPLLIGAILLAGLAWIAGAVVLGRVEEYAGATDGGKKGIDVALDNLSYLRDDRQLQVFILTRALLTVTALAPPFIAGLVFETSSGPGSLGWLIFASAGAALVSSYVWGALADRSSRKVLVATGALAALALGVIAANHWALGGLPWLTTGMLFILMLGYEGVRLGRSTHLVDMASEETRAIYTALSNTIIGLVLIAGSGFSLLAGLTGPVTVIAVMAVFSVLAALVATRLEEVQR